MSLRLYVCRDRRDRHVEVFAEDDNDEALVRHDEIAGLGWSVTTTLAGVRTTELRAVEQLRTETPADRVTALRRLAAAANVSPVIYLKIYSADGHAKLLVPSETWLDATRALLEECAARGVHVRAVYAKHTIDPATGYAAVAQWSEAGWRVRDDFKRAVQNEGRAR